MFTTASLPVDLLWQLLLLSILVLVQFLSHMLVNFVARAGGMTVSTLLDSSLKLLVSAVSLSWVALVRDTLLPDEEVDEDLCKGQFAPETEDCLFG